MRVFASGLLLVASLLSCRPPDAMWRVWLGNYEPTLGHLAVRVCTGELTATVVVGTQVNVAATAEVDAITLVDVRLEGVVRGGDLALLEATCTDEDGSEVGYARVEGRVRTPHHPARTGATYVYPPPATADGGSVYADCLSPTEARGRPPCIVEWLVTED